MSHTLSTSKGTLAIRPAVQEDAYWLRELRLEALTNQPQSFTADFSMYIGRMPEASFDA